MITITSKNNDVLKLVRSLHTAKAIKKTGLFLVEGKRAVLQALEQGAKAQIILIPKDREDKDVIKQFSIDQAVKIYAVSEELIPSYSDTVHSQGILAVFSVPERETQELFRMNRLLLLDRIQDPGNLGTMIRTVDGAGFDGILLLKGTTNPYAPKVGRSCLGANAYIPLFEMEIETLIRLKHRFRLLAADLDHRTVDFKALDYTPPIIIAVGNEANGLSDAISSLCDGKGMIPLLGRAESLNASIAAALLMYEAIR